MEIFSSDNNGSYHKPVMPGESGQYLINNPGGVYVDCTLGGGGHSEYFLSKYPGIRIIGIDCDEEAIKFAALRLEPFKERVRLYRDNFKNLKEVLSKENIGFVDGVFADLGVSSRQLDERARGFSFSSQVLDMRMDSRTQTCALDLLNKLDEAELADIFYKLGEERFSRQISRQIVRERESRAFSSAQDLIDAVCRVKKGRSKINPATKVFQALRIYVNRELENLEVFLESLPAVLSSGGRAVVISYHSLEDRLVKQSFRKYSDEGLYKPLTKKVVVPQQAELQDNPRSRSAKLRAAEKS